jgi:hypothetical protein
MILMKEDERNNLHRSGMRPAPGREAKLDAAHKKRESMAEWGRTSGEELARPAPRPTRSPGIDAG